MFFPTVDLTGFYSGTVSLRRLWLCIKRLLSMRGDSALAVALLGEKAAWSDRDHMIADLIERLDFANWLTANINRGKSATQTPFPERYPRPGYSKQDAPPASEFATPAEISRVLAALHN